MAAATILRQWRRNKRRVLSFPAGLARRRLQPIRTKFYDSLWASAAESIGAELTPAANGLKQVHKGGQTTFVRQSSLMLDSDITLAVFANKALHYDLMVQKSLRLPAFKKFTLHTINDAEAFLESQPGPIVVKPADGTGGGHGVTTGIATSTSLRAAAKHAAGFNPVLLAEQQLSGACFRLVYFNGEFLDAVRRDSPIVIGDGTSSIAQLVKAENQSRLNLNEITALNPLVIDQESRNTLSADGNAPNSIPSSGQTVRVKMAVNENAAPQNTIVRNQVHSEIIDMGVRLVRDFGLKFAGLDITSDDISAPLEAGNTFFNEINVNPGIHHHYLVANPQHSAELAAAMLDRMFSGNLGVMKL